MILWKLLKNINYLTRKLIIAAIKGYQLIISPLFPPACRFYPTCSNYSIQAIEKHGLTKGLLFSLWRVLRCNPFNKGGYDPLNEMFIIYQEKLWKMIRIL